jgi:hypothetical protein
VIPSSPGNRLQALSLINDSNKYVIDLTTNGVLLYFSFQFLVSYELITIFHSYRLPSFANYKDVCLFHPLSSLSILLLIVIFSVSTW